MLIATCAACGKPFLEGHNCPVVLTELENDLLPVVMILTVCDHYCCGHTKYVCMAKNLLASLERSGYRLEKIKL